MATLSLSGYNTNQNSSGTFKTPGTSYVQPSTGDILRSVQSALPKTYSSGTPFLDKFFPKAYAAETSSNQPVGSSTDQFGPLADQYKTTNTNTTNTNSNTSGLDPHINPSTGMWDDNWYASQQKASQDQNAALLSSLNTQYDQTAENLRGQLGYLDESKTNSLNELNTAYTGVENQVKQSKTSSQTGTQDAINQAGSVAQSTQLQNRNILRALGILNSTAGGDLLSKPINEFDKQRATLVAQNLQRISDLDMTLTQKASEHANAVKSLETNYSNLVGQIQSDLRFNDRQRADAIKSANAALQQRMADIQTSMFNYKTQIDTAKANANQTIQGIANYTQPTANTSLISQQTINPNQVQSSSNAQIYGQDQQKKNNGDYSLNLNSALLSGGLQ